MATESTRGDHIHLPQEGGGKLQAEIQFFTSCSRPLPPKDAYSLVPILSFNLLKRGKTSQFNTLQHSLMHSGQKPRVSAKDF